MIELKGNCADDVERGGDLIQLYANQEVGASMSAAYIYTNSRRRDRLCRRQGPIISDMGAQA